MKGGIYSLERVGKKNFHEICSERMVLEWEPFCVETSDDLRGVLWVDEDKQELEFDTSHYVGFCKTGDDHYREITTRLHVRRESQGVHDMVLKGYTLYIFTTRQYIRILDLSAHDGFEDESDSYRHLLHPPVIESGTGTEFFIPCRNIAVTRSEDVLLVCTLPYKDSTSTRHRIFRFFKRDPNEDPTRLRPTPLLEVDSLGDEALLLDSGITVPADQTLGIEPNSIYFTRDDRIRRKNLDKTLECPYICVYNLATKTLKRFPHLSELNLKDALWFLPS
ncbi:hypothetical protein AALP_AA8G433800 [Arabis alpina]|uniref:KIB1-4 beta-propeller domain-containing protein n=1 Tax=Arabis alpina TaxID=50452 RepID=A0A087GD66_ARAAL|nr:hypothetical protein AALP_AA8G433800 [Arabis alpina]